MCKIYGFEDNPLKQKMKKDVRRQNYILDIAVVFSKFLLLVVFSRRHFLPRKASSY